MVRGAWGQCTVHARTCSARRSPIIASIVYVQLAPANDSTRDLRPGMAGIAAISLAKRSYRPVRGALWGACVWVFARTRSCS